ncbi:MAG: DUF4870 domain-containing protein [Holosporaceae bacterium]|nr:MAG: DUF4870 domain-containing protein [Holosporaceae bacterium]
MKNSNHSFWAMMCHLSSLIGFLLPGFSIIAPLIVWGLKRHDHPLIMKNGRNVINFILSYWIYTFGLLAILPFCCVRDVARVNIISAGIYGKRLSFLCDVFLRCICRGLCMCIWIFPRCFAYLWGH